MRLAFFLPICMRLVFSLPICLALVGCGAADSDPGPGGVSVEDARALDEAAAKLDSESRNSQPDQ